MPARKSESYKTAAGTMRESRRKQVPAGERLLEAPLPPSELSPGAAVEWGRLTEVLVEVGSLTRADLRGLALLCELLADVRDLEEQVRRDGYLVPAANGGTKGNPASQALATARAQARQMLSDYGLNPRARGSVDAAPDGGPPEDPAAKYFT